MSVILKDIDVKKRETNNYAENNCEMYSLDKYMDIAKKCISLFSGPQNSSPMIKDEDAVSHVAEHIMWGHLRWRQDGGRTLKSYLNQCAIWSIKVWKTKAYNNKDKKILSLNHPISAYSDEDSQHYEIVADKSAEEPFDILFNRKKDEVKKILKNNCLTNLQNLCLNQRYIHGKKLQEIANEMGVSRQAVNQHIKKGVNKLRKYHGICER